MDALETKLERVYAAEIEAARRTLADQIADNRLLETDYHFQSGVREGLNQALTMLENSKRKLYGER